MTHAPRRRRISAICAQATAGVDVNLPLQIAAAYVAVGRKVRLQWSHWEGPESAPKPPFYRERETGFTARIRGGLPSRPQRNFSNQHPSIARTMFFETESAQAPRSTEQQNLATSKAPATRSFPVVRITWEAGPA